MTTMAIMGMILMTLLVVAIIAVILMYIHGEMAENRREETIDYVMKAMQEYTTKMLDETMEKTLVWQKKMMNNFGKDED